VDGNSVEELGAELHDYICGPQGSQVNLVIERNAQELPAISIRRESLGGGSSTGRGPTRIAQSYEQVPFYTSEQDKNEAILEATQRGALSHEQMTSACLCAKSIIFS
jgi:hypothetical protein